MLRSIYISVFAYAPGSTANNLKMVGPSQPDSYSNVVARSCVPTLHTGIQC